MSGTLSTNLNKVRRARRLSASFAGLDTAGCYALKVGLPAVTVNPIEKCHNMCKYLSKHLGRKVDAVDARNIDLSTLEDAEIFHASFPCTPFARCGDGEGFDDEESKLFYAAVDEAEELKIEGSLWLSSWKTRGPF